MSRTFCGPSSALRYGGLSSDFGTTFPFVFMFPNKKRPKKLENNIKSWFGFVKAIVIPTR